MDLTRLSTPALERLASALASGRLAVPLSALTLSLEGIADGEAVADALNPLGSAGARAVVAAVLAERRAGPVPPELVWTGPESSSSGARSTAAVLSEVLQRATSRVLLAGFAFDHAQDVLEPLHEALRRGVACRLYADEGAGDFLEAHWPFGPPFPEVFTFAPPPGVYASLHAKCVVVDGRWLFVTSANFTDRGQTRNVEVGVLIEDEAAAGTLEAQFSGKPWFLRRG